MAAPKKIDYERIEPDWRAGIKSPAQMAAEYTRTTGVSVSHAAIIKHFKKLGVPRDLAAKVHAKAEAMVMESMVTGKVSPVTTKPDAEVIAQTATLIAGVSISHRKDAATARALCLTLLAELNTVTGERLTVELIQDLLDKLENPEGNEARSKSLDKARDALNKAMSLPSRASSLKALADSLKTLITIEREAWGLKTDKDGETPKSAANGGFLTDDELYAIASSGRARAVDPPAGQG